MSICIDICMVDLAIISGHVTQKLHYLHIHVFAYPCMYGCYNIKMPYSPIVILVNAKHMVYILFCGFSNAMSISAFLKKKVLNIGAGSGRPGGPLSLQNF